jgi:PAS domain S-box-containing protein
MKDPSRASQELIAENSVLKQRIQELEQAEPERKRAEEERRRLSDIIERSLNEIYIFDSDTLKFKHVNLGALKNLQYSLEEIRELTPIDVKPELTETSFRTMIKPLLANEQDKLIFQTVHRRADGSLYPVEVHLQLVNDDKQRAFLAVIFDITERKKAEEALIKSEEKFRKVFYTSPDAVNINRLEDGMYVSINPGFTRIMGYTEEEIIGKTSIEYNI